MDNQISSVKRIILSILAIVIGVAVVYGFSFLSNKTRGPLAHSMDKISEFVYDIDYKYTLGQREDLRKHKLEWFESKRTDKAFLINPDRVLYGGSDATVSGSFENLFNLEDSLEISLPLIHIFNAWGKKPSQQFPIIEVKTILELGSIPIITWEPWLVDFDIENKELQKIDLDFDKSLLAISKGIYDDYIRTWAKEAASVELPIYLRFAHEMNDEFRYPWATKTNLPSEFILAWKHVYNIFKEEQANNVIWVWSPHIAYSGFEKYYPGDEYVDVLGTTILNYGTVVEWSEWWSFKELFGDYYDELQKIDKPIMLCEFSSLDIGGDRAEWFVKALSSIYTDYPLVRSVVFFQHSKDRSVTEHVVNWRIKDDKKTVDKIKSIIKQNKK